MHREHESLLDRVVRNTHGVASGDHRLRGAQRLREIAFGEQDLRLGEAVLAALLDVGRMLQLGESRHHHLRLLKPPAMHEYRHGRGQDRGVGDPSPHPVLVRQRIPHCEHVVPRAERIEGVGEAEERPFPVPVADFAGMGKTSSYRLRRLLIPVAHVQHRVH